MAFDDGVWAARSLLDVPGWLFLATKDHVEFTWNLTDAQAASLGVVLRSLSGALREASGAERVHVIGLGETAPHFHLALLGRRPGEEPAFTGAPLGERASTAADPERARAITGKVREALAQTGS
jgi:diadenosine tetraphosphate (Ap4A) HIT family hydrolase